MPEETPTTGTAESPQSAVIDVNVPRRFSTKPEPPAIASQPESQTEPAPEPVPEVKVTEPTPPQPVESKHERDARITAYYALLEENRRLREQAQPVPVPQAPAVDIGDPEPAWEPEKYAQKGGYDGFVKDLGRWAARQEHKTLRVQYHEDQEVAKFMGKIAKANLSDYMEVVSAAQARFESPGHKGILEAIRDSEVGPQIAYHLAKHPEDVKRIDALFVPRSDGLPLPSLAQLRELAKLETQFIEPAPVPTEPATVSKGMPTAPPPITPLRPSAANPTPDPIKLAANNADLREFAAASGIKVQTGRFSRSR